MLTRQTNKHPIVFLKDIRPKHLEQLLQYMYNGEINVLQVGALHWFSTSRREDVQKLWVRSVSQHQ